MTERDKPKFLKIASHFHEIKAPLLAGIFEQKCLEAPTQLGVSRIRDNL
jgi:hypothetical protein